MPFWFWFVTATLGLGSIAISGFTIIYKKLAELDSSERSRT